MHASAEKILKPKSHPVPRMKRAAPRKQGEPADGRFRTYRRRDDGRRILPGVPYWLHSELDADGFRRHTTCLNWANNQVRKMRGQTRTNFWPKIGITVVTSLERLACRGFRKFARHHTELAFWIRRAAARAQPDEKGNVTIMISHEAFRACPWQYLRANY